MVSYASRIGGNAPPVVRRIGLTSVTRMNLLFSTGSVHHLDTEMSFWLAHMANFDAVELLLDRRFAKAGLDVVTRYIQHYEMPVRNVHAPLEPIERWGDYWGNVRQALTWTKELGARLLNVHPYAPLRWLGRRRRVVVRRLEGLRDAARPLGIAVAIENLPRPANPMKRLTFSRYRRLGPVADLARRCGIQLTLDTTHAATWGTSPISAFSDVGSLLGNLHLSDYARGRQHLLPRQGELPLDNLLTSVHLAGYKGPITLEVDPDALGRHSVEKVLPALTLVRKWMARHAGR
jgi:sugar phosphate isomerase/epimerase